MSAKSNPVKGLLSRPGEVHPVVSGVQFSAFHDRPRPRGASIGATMNVHTGDMVVGGETEGYGVGGAAARNGKQYPTVRAGRRPRLDTVISTMQSIKREIPSENASIGSWYNRDTHNTDLDASEVIKDYPTAMNLARSRREKAIFDFKKLEDIPVKP